MEVKNKPMNKAGQVTYLAELEPPPGAKPKKSRAQQLLERVERKQSIKILPQAQPAKPQLVRKKAA